MIGTLENDEFARHKPGVVYTVIYVRYVVKPSTESTSKWIQIQELNPNDPGFKG